MTAGLDVKMIRIVVFASLFGMAVVCAVAVCTFLLYRRLTAFTNGKWTPARIKISGSPLDSASHIKLLHQQPRLLGGSGMTSAEMSPLMRHQPLRDAMQPDEVQHRMGGTNNCQTLTTTTTTQQPHMSSSTWGSRKTLTRPLSQSASYLARPSSHHQRVVHQTSLTNLVGSGYGSDANDSGHQGQRQEENENPEESDVQRTPQLEITLVYVSASAQLLVHIHRLSNATPVRCGKESSGATQVKVVLDGRIKRAFRSALVVVDSSSSSSSSSANPSSSHQLKSQQPQQRCAQVFKFPDVTIEELLNGRLTTTIYLGRGRWKSDKKIGSFNVRLGEMALADGVPRSLTGLVILQKQETDSSVGQKKKKDVQAEPCRRMTGAPELGQLLISLRHERKEQQREAAAGRSSSSRLLKVLIHRAQGLPPTKTLFEPDYIVVVNSSYPDGGSEIKETRPARGKAPEWNQTIEFDVTHRPIGSCWLHLVLIRKTKKGHSPNATVGHLTLGANSTPDGERHWQSLVNTHDVEITQWHRLTSR